jgi:cardiolipin synthase
MDLKSKKRNPFSNDGYSSGHALEWHRGGQVFFDHVVSKIDSAEKIIHFQVYLIESDQAGKMIIDALVRAASKGVEVLMVIDDFGAGKLDKADEQRMTESGITLKRFQPYASFGDYYFGRRMHHKVIVIDDRWALVAGMNFANRYKGDANSIAWLDYGVSVEGPVCRELSAMCLKIVERKFSPGKIKLPTVLSKENLPDPNEVWVRMRRNDFLRNRRDITRSYNNAVRNAKNNITIVGGYFLPGRRFLSLLRGASKRGVKISIIMTRFSDVPIVKRAAEYLYGRLLRADIRIFECNNAMVHGKVAVVDNQWATIGSYNQNQLSAYISIELNLDIVNQRFCTDLNNHLNDVIKNECTEITDEDYARSNSPTSQFMRWISYLMVRISMRMLFAMNRIFGVND